MVPTTVAASAVVGKDLASDRGGKGRRMACFPTPDGTPPGQDRPILLVHFFLDLAQGQKRDEIDYAVTFTLYITGYAGCPRQ
jgi:hypothetical protein